MKAGGWTVLALAALSAMGAVHVASADNIVFTDETVQFDPGRRITLLSMKGGSEPGDDGFVKKYRTWSVGQLADTQTPIASSNTLNLVVTMTGSDVLSTGSDRSEWLRRRPRIAQSSLSGAQLGDMTLSFYDGDGKVLFTKTYDAPSGGETLSKTTSDSGWLFLVHLTDAERDEFFGDPSNRIGLSVGGLQGRSNAAFVLSNVPEPAETVGLLGMWLVVAAAFGLKRYRRFQQHRARQAGAMARASAAE